MIKKKLSETAETVLACQVCIFYIFMPLIHFIAYAYLFFITRNHAQENSRAVTCLAMSEQLVCLAILAKLHCQTSVSSQGARFFVKKLKTYDQHLTHC